MSLTYIVVALLAVILNNVLVERLSMHTRITVGTSACRDAPAFIAFSCFSAITRTRLSSSFFYKRLHLNSTLAIVLQDKQTAELMCGVVVLFTQNV